MPTEREHAKYNDLGHNVAKYKTDHSSFRPVWLRQLSLKARHNWITAWFTPAPCIGCWLARVVMSVLAVYGLYSLFF